MGIAVVSLAAGAVFWMGADDGGFSGSRDDEVAEDEGPRRGPRRAGGRRATDDEEPANAPAFGKITARVVDGRRGGGIASATVEWAGTGDPHTVRSAEDGQVIFDAIPASSPSSVR